MTWVIWAIVLMSQSAATTWASRARNSRSLPYHAVAATCSHGVWFVSNLMLLTGIMDAARSSNVWTTLLVLGLFYTTFNVIGGVIIHHVSMTYLEKGNRKVG